MGNLFVIIINKLILNKYVIGNLLSIILQRQKTFFLLILLLLILFSIPSYTAPVCDVINEDKSEFTNELAKMVDKQESIIGKYKVQLKSCRSSNANQNEIIADLEQVIADYKKISTKSINLQNKYDNLVDDYKSISDSYRNVALNRGSAISFELGIGASRYGHETKSLGLIGVSVNQYKIWGILQENNNGVMIGKSFPFN